MEARRSDSGRSVDEADGDGMEGADDKALLRVLKSVSNRSRSPSNEVWVFY